MYGLIFNSFHFNQSATCYLLTGSTTILINYRLLAISTIFLASILPMILRRILLIPIVGDDVVHSQRCLDTKEDRNKAQEDHNALESLL